MDNRFRVDAAIYDPSVETEDGESNVVCQLTTFGQTLEGAVANSMLAVAPHLTHMDYEVVVVGVGVWCRLHECYHDLTHALSDYHESEISRSEVVN